MKFKKTIALLLVFAMLFCLSACTPAQKQTEPNENQIKDATGNIIDLPEDPTKATVASVYTPSNQFFVALRITDRVLALNKAHKFLVNHAPNLADAGTIGTGNVDKEKLAMYAPTALVHRSNGTFKKEVEEIIDKLGVDVIRITVENMEDVKTTLSTLGKYFGADEAAKEAVEWIDNKFALIDSIVAQIPESERKTALCMGGELGRIAGNDMLQSWMIEKAGGICVADEGKDHNWINVDEKVFVYNPDVLFCSSSTRREYDIDGEDGIKSDPAWSAMNCVINSEIYIIPCQQESWDMPGIIAVVGTFYMLHTMYPDYFTEAEFEEQVDDYYNFMYGETFTKEELGY